MADGEDDSSAASLPPAAFAVEAYRTILGRAPGAAELEAIVTALNAGVPHDDFLGGIVRSPEFHRRLRCAPVNLLDLGLDDESFLRSLYRETLHREIDSIGLSGNLERLSQGTSREEILWDVVRSPEFQARLATSTVVPPPRRNLLSMKPERYSREGEFLLFRIIEPADYDWLEEQILANHYYETAGSWGYEIDLDKEVMAEFLSLFDPARGLEIGCGTGAVLECLRRRGMAFDGLEISAFSIRRSFEAVRERIRQGDLLTTSFPDASFDVLVGLDVFEHLNPNKLAHYVSRIRQILASDGFLVINVPAFGNDEVFGTVHTFWVPEWRLAAAARTTFDLVPTDDLGYPLMGHLVWADTVWWETRLRSWGFARQRPLERALHSVFDGVMERTPARRSYFVFQPEGASDARRNEVLRRVDAYDRGRLRRLADSYADHS